jgi:UDP-N-acetylglucosamine acyltransferase
MSEIDPRSVISPSAKLGKCVRISAFAIVGDEVELGDGCILEPHAVVRGPAKLGPKNHVYSFSVLGGDPQDYTYTGQRVTIEIGESNEFREFSTVNRGTIKGGGVTRVGSNNLIMSYAHVGHDCTIGNRVTLINGCQLAGHIHVEDYATISSFCLLHQFSRVGAHSYIGAGTVITQDVPPFSLIVSSRETRCFGINRVGLERHGFSADRIRTIEKAFRYLLRSKLNTTQAVEKMRGTLADSTDVLKLIEFIESTTDRGLTK